MDPVRTRRTKGTYRGPVEGVGDLPFWRVQNELGGTTVYSVWRPSNEERAAICDGADVLLGIWSEPIPPVSLSVIGPDEAADVAELELGAL